MHLKNVGFLSNCLLVKSYVAINDLFVFSVKYTIITTTCLVRKSYNTFDFSLFVREGKYSVFILKFWICVLCYLGTKKLLDLDYLYADLLVFVYQSTFPVENDRNFEVAHISFDRLKDIKSIDECIVIICA